MLGDADPAAWNEGARICCMGKRRRPNDVVVARSSGRSLDGTKPRRSEAEEAAAASATTKVTVTTVELRAQDATSDNPLAFWLNF
ncbi:hypothetical protein [Nannocystis pusilla]|uniref:hypothetical protein n=1 Tax=Nannocystis pusilla TaxID=889268 RepID=UPI003BF29589